MTDSDRSIAAWRMPTRAELADRLGIPDHSLGTITETYDGSGAFADAVIGTYIERVAVKLDASADWPPKPVPPPFPAVNLKRYRAARERKEAAEADRATQREAIARHYEGLRHLAAPILASARVQNCRPAWLIAAQAIDAERATYGVSPPTSAVVACALGLVETPPPPRWTPPPRRWGRVR